MPYPPLKSKSTYLPVRSFARTETRRHRDFLPLAMHAGHLRAGHSQKEGRHGDMWYYYLHMNTRCDKNGLRLSPTVLINRAVPGSGKTTFARNIYATMEREGVSVRVHSTDDYFMVDGRYVFDIRMLGEYHRRNLEAFKASLAEGIGLVVLDNTDEHPWETHPYTAAARAAGYRILFMNFLPREFEKHLAAQQVTPEKPDAHQVPEDSLRQHIADFLAYNDLLKPDAIPDPARHANYRWDPKSLSLIRLDTPVVAFDFDDVIVIRPEDYHALKDKIGEMVLERMRG